MATTVSNLGKLEIFLETLPGIDILTPNSPEFNLAKTAYIVGDRSSPLAIVRPQKAEHVAALVTFSTANNIQFTIRGGGNNLFGLSCVQDALMIDLRNISYVEVDDPKSTARVGGGILFSKLASILSENGLACAMGSIPFIGYAGWAMYGGYGSFSANYGLGVDNILAAKVVNWEGKIVDADENMLKGIRGAGGFIGVIVELTIKVYPLKDILAGLLIYDSQDLKSTIKNFNSGYQELLAKEDLSKLNVQELIVNTPHGKVLALGFLYSSDDIERGQSLLAQIEALGTVVMNTVSRNTISAYMDSMAKLVPAHAYGSLRTISLRSLTEEVLDLIVSNCEKMPTANGNGFCMHELRGPSSKPKSDSVFAAREPHYVIEIIGTPEDEQYVKEAYEWMTKFQSDLQASDPANIVSGTYLSLTTPEEFDLRKIYGNHTETVLELKKKYDPHNVFNLSIPNVI
ncbi:D-lactate dehydrogenase [Bisporella sp. PMI_857]|nr:D-lactate dehydrogenase [Bisporella sp. PMI_857]